MIRLSAVTKTFKKTRVLDSLSLEVGPTERLALVGSNGAGKTTLIRCLLGQYEYQGDVRVLGLDPRNEREAVLGAIGFVPQMPPPLKMPVAELVRFTAGVSGTDAERVHHIAERLGLDLQQVASRPFVKLSGGQKQKLLIAIALGRDSKVLIMDEPAANLDPAARAVFFALLAERHDGAMIISSHRLDEVASLVNRVVELDRGRVVLDDKVEDVVDMKSLLRAELRIGRAEPAFIRAMTEWKFVGSRGGLSWEGLVAGPDRLRFLCMLSRYAGLFTGIVLEDEATEENCNVALRRGA